MVEGGEAKASLEIQLRGGLYASSAEAGGCLTDTGSETVAQSDAIEIASIDNGSGPAAGVNTIGLATAGGALMLYRGNACNCGGRLHRFNTMLQCVHLIPSKSCSKPIVLNH